MYPAELIRPMRAELTAHGVKELTTADQVDALMKDRSGTALVVINSVCGCAAGNARPAIAAALKNAAKPGRAATVFAGVDTEATARFRSFLGDLPPSSPSIYLFKDGELEFFLPRHMIEGRDARTIAQDLIEAFNEHCAVPARR